MCGVEPWGGGATGEWLREVSEDLESQERERERESAVLLYRTRHLFYSFEFLTTQGRDERQKMELLISRFIHKKASVQPVYLFGLVCRIVPNVKPLSGDVEGKAQLERIGEKCNGGVVMAANNAQNECDVYNDSKKRV